MVATSQGTPVAAAAPPSPDVPWTAPELLEPLVPPELPEPDDVPGLDDEAPPEELLTADDVDDETGTASPPGTTMTWGSDPEPPHAPDRPTHRHPHPTAERILARWVVTGLDMGVARPVASFGPAELAQNARSASLPPRAARDHGDRIDHARVCRCFALRWATGSLIIQ
jgi:hypothetical protein